MAGKILDAVIVDMLSILKSKPHNPHYVLKYYNFILRCDEYNLKNNLNEYTELHHIAPAAKDLFPEYSNLKNNKWNGVRLTARQHILAHVILWKTFGGSQITALDCMLNRFNSNTNESLNKRIIPESIKIRYLAKLRVDNKERKSKFRMGKAVYKDENGSKYLLDKNNIIIAEKDLKGHMSGFKFTEEQKKRVSDGMMGHEHSKETRKKIGDSNRGKIRSNETREKISVTHLGKILLPETKEKIRKANVGKKLSDEHKNKIGEGNSGKIRTTEQNEANRQRNLGNIVSIETRKKTSETVKQLRWITDGIINRRVNINFEIPIGWYYGRTKNEIRN